MNVVKDILVERVYNIEAYDLSSRVYVTEVTKKKVTGVLIYSTSPYGAAVCEDVLEEGKMVTFDMKDIVNVDETDIYLEKEDVDRLVSDRKKAVSNFAKDGRHNYILQKLLVKKDEYSDYLYVTIQNGGIGDTSDACQMYESYLYVNANGTFEDTKMAIMNRNERYSSSGTLIPATKIIVGLKEDGEVFETDFEHFKSSHFSNILLDSGIDSTYVTAIEKIVEFMSLNPLDNENLIKGVA